MSDFTESYEKICIHVERHIGTINHVHKEIVSDLHPIDILVVKPTPSRNFYTLITDGMSKLPMTVPDGAEEYQFTELMICLPPTWKFSDEALKDDEHYWPIGALRVLAKFPHEYNTWLSWGHTVANGNPIRPYSKNTLLQGMLLWLPDVKDQNEFFNLPVSEDKVVHFYNLIPLYAEEIEYKLKNDADALYKKLIKTETVDIVNISRKNTCKKVWGIF